MTFTAELHRSFIFIHPFEDGDGKTARQLMNTALIQRGFALCYLSLYA
ncbi:Fic family protein [Lacrimispora sp.]